jgi:hypothetical protein
MFSFKNDIEKLKLILKKIEKESCVEKKLIYIQKGDKLLKKLKSSHLNDVTLEEYALKLYVYENRAILEKDSFKVYLENDNIVNILNDMIHYNIKKPETYFCFCL